MNKIKIIGIILVLAISPILLNEVYGQVTVSDTFITVDDSNIYLRFKSNATEISSNTILFAGFTMDSVVATAIDPVSEDLYAIIRTVEDFPDQRLVTINATTGTVTDVVLLTDRIQTIQFKDDGELRAITDPEFNDTWFFAMGEIGGSCGTGVTSGGLTTTELSQGASSTSNNRCKHNVWKSFEADKVEGSTVFIKWRGVVATSISGQLQVRDGFFSGLDFFCPPNIGYDFCTKGVGIMAQNVRSSNWNSIDSVAIPTGTGLTDHITVDFRFADSNGNVGHTGSSMQVDWINVTGTTNGFWNFTSLGGVVEQCSGTDTSCTTGTGYTTNREGTIDVGDANAVTSGTYDNAQHYFDMDKTTGVLTELCGFSDETIGGDQLAFNWNDGFMYRFTGYEGTELESRMFRITDESTCVEVETTLSGLEPSTFTTAMIYHTGDGVFYGTDSSSRDYYNVTLAGVVTEIENTPFTVLQEGMEFLLSILFDPPVITLVGNSFVEVFKGATYNDAGATCLDNGDGDLTSSIVEGGLPIDTSIAGVNNVTYDCQDSSGQNAQQVVRQVVVSSSTGGGGGSGQSEAPVSAPEEGLTQAEFDQALAEAIAQIQSQQLSVLDNILTPIFEFAVVDNTHDNVALNSFFDDQRLGIRWSSGQDIIISSVVPSGSPFTITFEQVPVIKQGSGAVISTDFLTYSLQVPRLECGGEITENCVQKVRYEIPVQVTAIIGNNTITDSGNITVDLVDELIDPVLVILLATFGIPLIAGLVQSARGKPTVEAIRRSV